LWLVDRSGSEGFSCACLLVVFAVARGGGGRGAKRLNWLSSEKARESKQRECLSATLVAVTKVNTMQLDPHDVMASILDRQHNSEQEDRIFPSMVRAVTLSAGVDVSQIKRYEDFVNLFPIICRKAYNALYNVLIFEKDETTNMDRVIDGLWKHTKDKRLKKICGDDVVVKKNEEKIGVLIGVFYREGKRIHLLNQEAKEAERKALAASKQTKLPSSDNRFNPYIIHLTLRQQEKRQREQAEEEMLLKMHTTSSAPTLSEVEHLMEEEEEEKENNKAQTPLRVVNKKRRKKRRSAAEEEAFYEKGFSLQMLNKLRKVAKRPLSAQQEAEKKKLMLEEMQRNDPDWFTDGYEDAQPHLRRNASSNSNSGNNKNRKNRPSSAPMARVVKGVVDRLYPRPVPIDFEAAAAAKKKKLHAPLSSASPFPSYTYDAKSGCKVALSLADIEERERKLQAFRLSEDDVNAYIVKGNQKGATSHLNSRSRSPSPSTAAVEREKIKPEWPGLSTGKSADEWVKKKRLAWIQDKASRGGGRSAINRTKNVLIISSSNNNKMIFDANSAAPKRLSQLYQDKMERLDVLISIEHCHDCDNHKTTLRHKKDEYEHCADQFLRSLAQIAHDCCLCARVGVTRFNTKLEVDGPPPSNHRDQPHQALLPQQQPHGSIGCSRIGAFEIHAAFCNEQGQIASELLHSKLNSMRWPSKSVLEKRLRAFAATSGIPSFRATVSTSSSSEGNDGGGEEECNSDYTDTGSDGLATYPIGVGPFSSTALANPAWTFSYNEDSSSSAQDAELPKIQWVYDSRKAAELETFKLGSTLRVCGLHHPRGGLERHSLVGVIKEISPDGNGNGGGKRLTLRLKYHTTEISVEASQCMSLSEYASAGGAAFGSRVLASDALPEELSQLLLMILSTGSSRSSSLWRAMDKADKVVKGVGGEVLLTRPSFFHQVRNLAWEMEAKFCTHHPAGTDTTQGLVKHLTTGKLMDLQLAYSEETLDWLTARFGHLIDMKALHDLARNSVSNDGGVSLLSLSSPRSPRPIGVPHPITLALPGRSDSPRPDEAAAIGNVSPRAAAGTLVAMVKGFDQSKKEDGDVGGEGGKVQEDEARQEQKQQNHEDVAVANAVSNVIETAVELVTSSAQNSPTSQSKKAGGAEEQEEEEDAYDNDDYEQDYEEEEAQAADEPAASEKLEETLDVEKMMRIDAEAIEPANTPMEEQAEGVVDIDPHNLMAGEEKEKEASLPEGKAVVIMEPLAVEQKNRKEEQEEREEVVATAAVEAEEGVQENVGLSPLEGSPRGDDTQAQVAIVSLSNYLQSSAGGGSGSDDDNMSAEAMVLLMGGPSREASQRNVRASEEKGSEQLAAEAPQQTAKDDDDNEYADDGFDD